MNDHKVVSHEDWIAARKKLLDREKEFTRLRDQISRERSELPWEEVRKNYAFESESGRQSLGDLFEGRSQLVIYHFMFGPDWEAGCPHCSFWADHFNPSVEHLQQRDVALAAVSRAPYAKLDAYRRRMKWDFKWVSSGNSDFNFDYFVSFKPEEQAHKKAFYNYRLGDPRLSDREGLSVFYRDQADRIFHTYSTYARGIDLLNTAYNILDLVPKGRDENGRGQFWVRRRDEYARQSSEH